MRMVNAENHEVGLLPCAVRDDASRGRRYEEPPDPLRTPFELDRHRILSCTAFRRVRAKTQVFAQVSGDHYRTRLTHTLEVSQVSRLISVHLRVNETLAETIALGHDLGHPPFGHAGEAALNEMMQGHGGFEHNAHALRVVEHLEHPYPWFRGLNLTFEVREGLARHTSLFDHPAVQDQPEAHPSGAYDVFPTVEAQVVNLADRLAYDLHDLEDAIGEGLIDAAALTDCRWWSVAQRDVGLDVTERGIHAIRRPVLDAMLRLAIKDCIENTFPRIQNLGSVDEVRRMAAAVVTISSPMQDAVAEVERLLADRVYAHERVRGMDAQARRIVRDLFLAYVRDSSLLPPRFRARIEEASLERVVCDYVAGMTDRFCEQQWQRICVNAQSTFKSKS